MLLVIGNLFFFQGPLEIGITTSEGMKCWTKIPMANLGCCLIRYKWGFKPHVDHFTTGRYRMSPFIFDCSDGVILPGQRVSTIYLIQYHCLPSSF